MFAPKLLITLTLLNILTAAEEFCKLSNDGTGALKEAVEFNECIRSAVKGKGYDILRDHLGYDFTYDKTGKQDFVPRADFPKYAENIGVDVLFPKPFSAKFRDKCSNDMSYYVNIQGKNYTFQLVSNNNGECWQTIGIASVSRF